MMLGIDLDGGKTTLDKKMDELPRWIGSGEWEWAWSARAIAMLAYAVYENHNVGVQKTKSTDEKSIQKESSQQASILVGKQEVA